MQAGQNWVAYTLPEEEDAAFECLESYLASGEVARGILRNPAKFIKEESENHWRSRWDPPLPQKLPMPNAAERRHLGISANSDFIGNIKGRRV